MFFGSKYNQRFSTANKSLSAAAQLDNYKNKKNNQMLIFCFLLKVNEFINCLWCLLVLSLFISSVYEDIHSSLQLDSVVGYYLQLNHLQL